MKVIEVLQSNKQALASCAPGEPIRTISERLSALNIGAMPVCGTGGALIGVISERDVVRGFASQRCEAYRALRRDLMTREVVTLRSG